MPCHSAEEASCHRKSLEKSRAVENLQAVIFLASIQPALILVGLKSTTTVQLSHPLTNPSQTRHHRKIDQKRSTLNNKSQHASNFSDSVGPKTAIKGQSAASNQSPLSPATNPNRVPPHQASSDAEKQRQSPGLDQFRKKFPRPLPHVGTATDLQTTTKPLISQRSPVLGGLPS